jgi:hypothetical protein
MATFRRLLQAPPEEGWLKIRMQKDRPSPPAANDYSASRVPRLGARFESQAIIPIPPNGFGLAARLHFMLSGHVAFPEQNGLALARATEFLAQRDEESAFVEPGNQRLSLSLNL